MNWPSIPRTIPRWLRRDPVALTAAVASVNVIARLRRRGSIPEAMAIVASAALLLILVTLVDWAGNVVRLALDHSGAVISASGVYAASLIARRRRIPETTRAQSWLVATPLASRGPMRAIVLTLLPLGWRLAAAVLLATLLSLDHSVTAGQSLQISALMAIGVAVGGPFGWWLSRRQGAPVKLGSRYTPRSRPVAELMPSTAALSRWPIAQAIAWGRPENARVLLGAALLTIPGGAGILGMVIIIGTGIVGSYLVSVFIAIPVVGRAALEWLRATPITFLGFSWPLVRRALVHQVIGTSIAVCAAAVLSASLSAAIYFGVMWLTLVVLVWAVCLADAYRAHSVATKAIVSTFAAVLAEERVRGLGVAIAIFVAAVHVYLGVRHERT